MNVGFTYELRDKTNPDLVYYGSSELPTLKDRLDIHIQNFKKWKNGKTNYCSSFKILELGNYTPTLLKIVFFTIKWELHEKERKLIEYQTCVNEKIPNRTPKEWREANKISENKRKAEYRKANKNKINEKFTCPCGGKYTYPHKSEHIKSQKHQKWLKTSNAKNH